MKNIRDFNLMMLTELSEIISFINSIRPDIFVKLHQDYLKDHYLSEPKRILDYSVIDDLDLYDIIREKYREFFITKGLDKTYEWLNPTLYSNYSSYLKREDFSMDMIKCELFGGDEFSDEVVEESYDMFNDLYYETASGWGWSWLILDILDWYIDSKQELEEELEELEEDFVN